MNMIKLIKLMKNLEFIFRFNEVSIQTISIKSKFHKIEKILSSVIMLKIAIYIPSINTYPNLLKILEIA